MATSARDLWWVSCFSNSTVIASTLARKTQRKWSWRWRAGTSTKQAISLFFALMPRSEKNETAFPCPKTPETNLLSQFLIRTIVGELKRHMLRDPLRDDGSVRRQVNGSPHLDLV